MKKCPSCREEMSWETEFCPGCGTETDYYMQPAGFWIRVWASILDSLIFIPIGVLYMINIFYWQNVALAIAGTIPGFIYKPFMESQFRATLGKMICKIRVLDDDGEKLSIGKAYVRFIPNLFQSIVGLIGLIVTFALIDLSTGDNILEAMGQAGQDPTSQMVSMLSNIILLFVLIDCLFVAFTERKRAIHDYMAGSYCVYKPTVEQLAAIAEMPVQGGEEPKQEYREFFTPEEKQPEQGE